MESNSDNFILVSFLKRGLLLTLKAPNKNCSRRHFIFFILSLEENKASCLSESMQRIHMKYQVLFSLKNNEEIFMNVVCCSCDWLFLRLIEIILLKYNQIISLLSVPPFEKFPQPAKQTSSHKRNFSLQ